MLKIQTEDIVLLTLFKLFSVLCTSLAACNFGSFERSIVRASTFILAQVRSSSYTEGDSKRKTSSERRRNVRIGENGKPMREADREGRMARGSNRDYRPWQDGGGCVCRGSELRASIHRAGEFGNGESFMAGEPSLDPFEG